MNTDLYKSMVWVRCLVDALEVRGIAGEELYRETDLAPGLLAEGLARISLHQWDTLVHRAIVLTRDPGLGITIASARPGQLYHILYHVLGPIAAACGSLRESTNLFQRYVPLLENTNRFELLEEGDRASFVCTPQSLAPLHPEFEAELALGLIYRSARRLAPRDQDDADEVWFSHAEPAHAARYAQAFRCPVHFGRPANAIVFARACLDASQIHGDPVLLELLCAGAEHLLAQPGSAMLPARAPASEEGQALPRRSAGRDDA